MHLYRPYYNVIEFDMGADDDQFSCEYHTLTVTVNLGFLLPSSVAMFRAITSERSSKFDHLLRGSRGRTAFRAASVSVWRRVAGEPSVFRRYPCLSPGTVVHKREKICQHINTSCFRKKTIQ